jgi:hypothetical protein
MKLTARFPFRTIACLILAGQALMAHDPHDPMQAVAVSPNFANDQTVFAATGVLSLKFGIYVLLKSTDGGVIWTAVQGMNNDSEILQIVFSPAYALDNTIYVAGLGGIFMSTNQGASWTQLTKLAVVNVALSANFGLDNTMFAVTNERSILMSTNRGTNFTFPTPPTSLTAGLTAIAISPNFDEDQTLLLGGLSNGIFLSTNGGSIWTPVTSGQTVSQVSSLAFSPNFTNDHTAFAGTFGTGVFLSTSAGTSWAASNSGGGGGHYGPQCDFAGVVAYLSGGFHGMGHHRRGRSVPIQQQRRCLDAGCQRIPDAVRPDHSPLSGPGSGQRRRQRHAVSGHV